MAAKKFSEALEGSRQIDVTVTGRKTGRDISFPVWFVRDGRTIHLLPVSGSDSNWYRNVLRTPKVRLSADGTDHRAEAVPVTDAAEVDGIVEQFRDKYGADNISAYYPKHDVAVEVPLG
jgi:deazaflavin-dependent oxidoreductase (nitroreductase family)